MSTEKPVPSFPVAEREQVEAIFGPKGSLTATMLMRRDPAAYRDMKLSAIYDHNYLPESALQFQDRLSKQQLEQRYQASVADEQVPVPLDLCEAYGWPIGKTLKNSQIRRLQGKSPNE